MSFIAYFKCTRRKGKTKRYSRIQVKLSHEVDISIHDESYCETYLYVYGTHDEIFLNRGLRLNR